MNIERVEVGPESEEQASPNTYRENRGTCAR